MTASGRNHCELSEEPIPRALISDIQQIGHLGAAATKMAVRAEKPIFFVRLLKTVCLGTP
jgi:hypothetical protein